MKRMLLTCSPFEPSLGAPFLMAATPLSAVPATNIRSRWFRVHTYTPYTMKPPAGSHVHGHTCIRNIYIYMYVNVHTCTKTYTLFFCSWQCSFCGTLRNLEVPGHQVVALAWRL